MPHCNKKMISFFLTTRCNLCCRYCYNAKERNEIQEHTIDLDFAFAGINWYFSHNNSRHIRFYGPGEPTQEFNKLKEITNFAKAHPNRGREVTVEIQTNGVFSQEVREWMLENMNIMWMSFDGMKDIQNYNRPLNPKYCSLFNGRTSADVLEDNVKWLIQNRNEHNLMVGARVTITDKNIEKQIEMVDYFYSLGIRYVWTNPLFYSVGKVPVCFDKDKQAQYHFNMEKYLEHYLKAFHYGKSKGLFWGSFLTINFDGDSYYHCRCCTPLEAPHLTPDGFISSCDMVVLGSEPHHMYPFIVGRWNAGSGDITWNEERIAALNERKSVNMVHCENCIAKEHCGGYCLGETVNETGSLFGQNPVKCAAIRYLYKELGSCTPYDYLHP